jgi:hypothetical protein
MSREELVRAHFEAFAELTWAKELKPKIRKRGADEAKMESLRTQWMRHTEQRDWGWWQEEVKQFSNNELQAGIRKCESKMDAIRQTERREKEGSCFDCGEQSPRDGGKEGPVTTKRRKERGLER